MASAAGAIRLAVDPLKSAPTDESLASESDPALEQKDNFTRAHDSLHGRIPV